MLICTVNMARSNPFNLSGTRGVVYASKCDAQILNVRVCVCEHFAIQQQRACVFAFASVYALVVSARLESETIAKPVVYWSEKTK